MSKILFAEPNPTPAKYALSLMGKCKADVREPLYELSSDTKKQVRKIRAELPKLNREKVDKELKLLLLDLQLMRNDLRSINNKEKVNAE